jgi:hypothetical protein
LGAGEVRELFQMTHTDELEFNKELPVIISAEKCVNKHTKQADSLNIPTACMIQLHNCYVGCCRERAMADDTKLNYKYITRI